MFPDQAGLFCFVPHPTSFTLNIYVTDKKRENLTQGTKIMGRKCVLFHFDITCPILLAVHGGTSIFHALKKLEIPDKF